MFHVASGSFYSHDLRDGQFIPSLIPDQDIQVGVRVDGCNRESIEPCPFLPLYLMVDDLHAHAIPLSSPLFLLHSLPLLSFPYSLSDSANLPNSINSRSSQIASFYS